MGRRLLVCLLASFGAVGCATVDITTMVLPDGVVGQAYSYQLEAKHGDTWVVEEGTLPPGIQLTGKGKLEGTPQLDGTYTFTLTADDMTSGWNPVDWFTNARSSARGFVISIQPN